MTYIKTWTRANNLMSPYAYSAPMGTYCLTVGCEVARLCASRIGIWLWLLKSESGWISQLRLYYLIVLLDCQVVFKDLGRVFYGVKDGGFYCLTVSYVTTRYLFNCFTVFWGNVLYFGGFVLNCSILNYRGKCNEIMVLGAIVSFVLNVLRKTHACGKTLFLSK